MKTIFNSFEEATVAAQQFLTACKKTGYIADTHKGGDKFTHGGIGILSYADTEDSIRLVFCMQKTMHSLNSVFIDSNGIPCVSTYACAVMDKSVTFEDYEEVFNENYKTSFRPLKIKIFGQF